MAWVPIAMAVGQALIAKQNHQEQKNQEQADINRAAETERYSPWTGMHGGAIRHPGSSEIGAMGQGALSGYMFGQQFGGAGGGSDWDQMANQGGQNLSGAAAAQQQKPSMYGKGFSYYG